MNKVPPKAMLDDSPGDAPVTISLRRVKELAASNRKHAMADMNHGLLTVSMTETDTAAALEALVRLVEAGMALNETADAWLHTQFFEEDGDADAAGVRAEDAKLAYHIALAQFIDDRQQKP